MAFLVKGNETVGGGSGGGGASALVDLTDVQITSPQNGQVLKYDNSISKYTLGDVDSIEKITPEYYYAHRAELEASGKTYMVTGTITGSTEADEVGYDNTTSGLRSTNVQDAIDELALNKNISDAWNSTTSYTTGALVIYNNQLYKCITANTNLIPTENPTYWSETSVGNELATGGSGDDVIFFGIEELMARVTFKTSTSTEWTELSRTTFRSIPPAKIGYTLKFKLCARSGTYEGNTCKIAFGNIQMLNTSSWSGLSSSNDDFAAMYRSGYYSVSQLTDIATEDGTSSYGSWYRLKFASSASGKQAYVMSAWLEWYYVKDV